jgi:hypothetical protein
MVLGVDVPSGQHPVRGRGQQQHADVLLVEQQPSQMALVAVAVVEQVREALELVEDHQVRREQLYARLGQRATEVTDQTRGTVGLPGSPPAPVGQLDEPVSQPEPAQEGAVAPDHRLGYRHVGDLAQLVRPGPVADLLAEQRVRALPGQKARSPRLGQHAVEQRPLAFAALPETHAQRRARGERQHVHPGASELTQDARKHGDPVGQPALTPAEDVDVSKVLPGDLVVRAEVDDVDAGHFVPQPGDRLGHDGSRHLRLAEADLVRHEEPRLCGTEPLAGLAKLEPWLHQWHAEPDPLRRQPGRLLHDFPGRAGPSRRAHPRRPRPLAALDV